MELNKFQTPIEELTFTDKDSGRVFTWENAPDEIKNDFNEFLNGVPLIKWLISKDRPYVKDLPRDERGHAIIDITHPPILENTDYFRPTAIHFKRTGKLTDLRPNKNPNSEYYKWQHEETRRCWNGYLREEDGAYIPGYMYWYLNYSPIMLSREVNGIDYQVPDLPDFWEGVWWRMTGWWEARQAKLNFAEISSRGKSKSYSLASGLSRVYTIGDFEPPKGQKVKNARAVVMAGTKEFLTKDGTLNKFEDMVSFLAEHTQYPAKQLQASLKDMTWQRGFIDLDSGTKRGTLNTVLGVAIKDDIDKARGKRPHPYYCNVLTTDGWKKWGDIKVGDFVYSPNGNPVKVIAIPFDGEDDIYKITLRDGRVTYAGKDHLFKVEHWTGSGYHTKYTSSIKTVEELSKDVYRKSTGYTYRIPKNDTVHFDERKLLIDPYCMGLFLGDGCANKCLGDKLDITMVKEDFESIVPYIPHKTIVGYKRDITHQICLLDNIEHDGKYPNYTKDLLEYYGLKGHTAADKFIPEDYLFNTEENRWKLLRGMMDTDGTCPTVGNPEYATKSKSLADDFMFLLRSLGINCSCYLKTFMRNDNVYYRIKIQATGLQLFNMPRKQARVAQESNLYNDSFRLRTAITNVEYVGKQPCKCITVENEDGLYLIDDFITTHNSAFIGMEEFGAFPNVDSVYNIGLPSVTDGEKTFGIIILVGTGGEEGNDFSGAMNMIYHPKGYGIKSFENVWDIEGRAAQTSIFCYPAYINRSGCMNEDGISDVTLALFRICCERWIKKYNNPDPMQLTRTKAEYPITLQDAIMQRDGAYFPVAQLMERLQEIDSDPNFYDGVYVGEMRQLSNGQVDFVNADLTPIRSFPHKTNKMGGAVEIYEMPVKDSTGRVPDGRYIGSCDPIDDDESGTMSLVSVFIFDLWTDRIVCEWTGRLDTADECYERVRLMLLFYNAKLLYEAHPYSQTVTMADGTTKSWGQVQIGDYLNAPNGKKVKVTDIPVDEYMPIYEITLRDGRKIKASGNHIWSVYTQQQRKKPVLLTTEMMMNKGIRNKHNQSLFFIPNGGEVTYEKRNTPIDPYTFGLLLAEGCFVPHHCYKNRVQFSSSKKDLEFYKTVIPYNIKEHSYDKNNSDILIPKCKDILKDLNLFGCKSYTKFIPDLYKYNDKETRLELLKGLMDGDGCATGKGASIFITTSERLADDICSLCRSLGINASYAKKEHSVENKISLHYRVSIFSEISIFKLRRKQEKEYTYHRELKGSKAASYIDKTAISEVRFCGFEMGKCVTVDSPDGLYMIGDYVVTHNCNKKGIFTYFKTMNCVKLMMETPSMLKDRTTQKESLNNTDYGINATEGVNSQARFFIKDWLLKPVHTVRIVDGEEQEITLHNYNFIKQRALIQELISWNRDGNFDRVSSFGILMFARQEKIMTTRGEFGRNKVSDDYKGNDEFFTRQWEAFARKNHIDTQ